MSDVPRPEDTVTKLRQWQHDLDMMFGSAHVVSAQGQLLLDAANSLEALSTPPASQGEGTVTRDDALYLRDLADLIDAQDARGRAEMDTGDAEHLRRIADLLTPPASPSPETREALASYAHDAWTGWMRYLFSRTTPAQGGMLIPAAWVERWQHQMDTPYDRLQAREQDSDRKEADRMLAIMFPPSPVSSVPSEER